MPYLLCMTYLVLLSKQMVAVRNAVDVIFLKDKGRADRENQVKQELHTPSLYLTMYALSRPDYILFDGCINSIQVVVFSKAKI